MNMPRYYVFSLMLSLTLRNAWALPDLPTVVSGSANVSSNGTQMTIQQNSAVTELQFNQFNIDANQQIEFIQPNTQSLAINRITGGQPSQLLGQLKANGQIFLLNSAGIIFGPNAQVDVGGLLATTLDIDSQDLSKREFHLQRDSITHGTIMQQGHVRIRDGGYALLISREVHNSGQIVATLGNIHLLSADGVHLRFDDHGLPGVMIDQATLQGLIDNQGEINATSGLIEMTVQASEQLWQTAINNQGLISADQIEHQNGEIRLVSSGQGDVAQHGEIRAHHIKISGQRIDHSGLLNANAANDAQTQSIANGGTIQLQASDTLAIRGTVNANAGAHGKGGEVIAFSPNRTLFWPTALIAARGGYVSGEGGFVEVSGQQQVQIFGTVDTRAFNGNNGQWLIDPFNIQITDTDNAVDFNATVYTPNGSGATINTASLTSNLALGNVTITTAGGGLEAGDISVNSAINLNGSNSNTLTLQADGSIQISANILDNDTSSIDNTNLIFNAAQNISMSQGTRIHTGSGNISFTASNGDILLSSLQTSNTSSSAVSLTASGDIINNDISATNIIANTTGALTTLNSGGGIQDLKLQVHTLNAQAVTQLSLTETDDLVLQLASVSASTDGISVITDNGGIQVSGSGVQLTGTGDLTLIAGDGDNSRNHTMDINAAVVLTGSGTLSLLNQTLGINFADAGDLTTTAGNISVNAAGGSLSMSEDTVFTSDTGNISLTGITGMTLNRVQTNSTDTSAVSLTTSTTTDITDTNGSALNVVANSGGLNFGNVRNVEGLETQVSTLGASGTIDLVSLNESDDLNFTDWNASGSQLTVIAAGNISSDDDSSTDITASRVNLTANTQIGDLSSNTLAASVNRLLQINAQQLALALTSDGEIAVADSSAAGNVLQISSINTANGSGSSVWLQADNNRLNLGSTTLGLNSADRLILQQSLSLTLPSLPTLDGLKIDTSTFSHTGALTANDLLLKLNSNQTLTTRAARIDAFTDQGSLNISNQIDSLLIDLDNDGLALSSSNGNVTFTSLGSLSVLNRITATDNSADGVRAGLIDLAAAGGNLSIGSGGAAQISSINTLDQNIKGGLGNTPTNQVSVRLRITDSSDTPRTLNIGDNNGEDVSISATGGDLLVAAGAGALGTDSDLRQLTVGSDVDITVANNSTDANTGTITLDEVTPDLAATLLAKQGRRLALSSRNLLAAEQVQTSIENAVRESNNNIPTLSSGKNPNNSDIDNTTDTPAADTPGSAPLQKRNISLALDRALPPCKPGDNAQSGYTCKQKEAIRDFLNSLMISKSLPVITTP
jgi:filamentous hemagglutinin family protein